MPRYKGILLFDGTEFVGWQTQHQSNSIEEHVHTILKQLVQEDIKIYGASRTDAGVHAEGFVFHVDIEKDIDIDKVRHSFNRLCLPTISLRSIEKVSDEFSARFSPSKKTYRYQLHQGDRSPFNYRFYHYVYRKLAIKKLEEVASLFLGTHKFHNFTIKTDDPFDFFRTIYWLDIEEVGEGVLIRFTGNGFMTHMVRMLVGTMLAYEKDKIQLSDIEHLLITDQRTPVPFKAEANGLCLERIDYETHP
jgi:tRNA pseudouridine38-40 synthase